MGWLKKRLQTLNAALGVKRFIIASVVTVVLALLEWANENFQVNWLPDIPAWTVIVGVPLILITWWVFEYAHKLKQRLEPRLSVTFDPKIPHYMTTEPKHSRELAVRTFRIQVENTGGENIRGCSVKLEKLLDRNEPSFSREANCCFRLMTDRPENPRQTGHRTEFDLAPGDKEFVDIVTKDEINDQTHYVLCYAITPSNPNPWSRIPQSKGSHFLTVRVVGDREPILRTYKISVDHHGFLVMENVSGGAR